MRPIHASPRVVVLDPAQTRILRAAVGEAIMKRCITPILVLLFAALAGCSSTPGTAVDTEAPSSQQATALPATMAPPARSDTPSATKVAGGTATDFCGAFSELQAVSDAPSGDMASVAEHFRSAASDMRKFAPADIAKAADTYAAVIGNIGKAVASGKVDESSPAKAISDGMAGAVADIGKVAMWVAKNCDL